MQQQNHIISKLLLFAIMLGFGSCRNSSCPNALEIAPYCICSGSSSITMDCSRVKNEDELELVFTSATFPSVNVTIIKIWNNEDLRSLTRNVFGDVTFEQIDFSDDVIEYIDESTFLNSVTTLNTWRMNHCNLIEGNFPFYSLQLYSELSIFDFSYAGSFEIFPKISSNSLRTINFDHCQVKFLPILALDELPNLAIVRLHFNSISSLTPGTFDKNSKLTNIRLSYNNIEKIEVGIFNNLLSLTHLQINSNKLVDVEVGSFDNLPSLDTLYLDWNILEYLPSLGNLSSLRSLSIYFNQIQTIEKGLLSGCPILDFFDAEYMNISLIEAGAFNYSPISGWMYLNGNFLTTLDESWLRSALENKNEVNLSQNPLECGCDAAWLFEDPSLMDYLYAYCKNGTLVNQLDPDFFTSNC